MPANRIPYAYYCGVPREHCSGSTITLADGIKGGKTHSQPEQGFACMCRYLVNVLGYKKLNTRDYQDPETGEVRVLTKPSRFGGRLRPGKEGTRNMAPAMRGCKGGMIGSY